MQRRCPRNLHPGGPTQARPLAGGQVFIKDNLGGRANKKQARRQRLAAATQMVSQTAAPLQEAASVHGKNLLVAGGVAGQAHGADEFN